jgi:hypothetical protein
VRPGTLVRHALWMCGRCHVSSSCFGFGALQLTCEKNLLTDELTRIGIEVSIKDEELKRKTESYMKTLD